MLWLYENQLELRTGLSQRAQSLLNIGDLVSEHTQKHFPNGVKIEFNPNNFDGMVKKTHHPLLPKVLPI